MSHILKSTWSFMKAGKQGAGECPNEYLHPTRRLRRDLLREEYAEYINAERDNDLVEMCDGLADIIVVAVGTLYEYVGYVTATEILDEVASSNLSKVVDGKLIKDANGKIQKPETYFKPNIYSILMEKYDG